MSATEPKPIYWRQDLFAIPYQYQWPGAGEPGSAQTVWLYVSRDRGASWQPTSEARPEVRAFNYRAEADGEYWFAIRTLDAAGRAWPAGPMEPELRVIVDTTPPRLDAPGGSLRGEMLEVHWRVADANFDAQSCVVEVELGGANDWRVVPQPTASLVSENSWAGSATMRLPPGQTASAVRITAFDLAGSRATTQAAVRTTATASGTPTHGAAADWTSAAGLASRGANGEAKPAAQRWPADASGAQEMPAPIADDRPLGNVPTPRRRPYAPLEPFREVSLEGSGFAGRRPAWDESSPPRANDLSWLADWEVAVPHEAITTLVNSRLFALEYELDDVEGAGVARVELWGTRDGGRNWRRFSVDDDNRSPLAVTVDGPGLYGFRIIVEGAGGPGALPPQPGDRPEMWVGVDLNRPAVRLTSAEPGADRFSDHLTLCWEAYDDNLEPRPIALFYSSRPGGPWTAIATSLENTGQYDWRLERHLPRRVYLRLEARDTAGNLAAYQTHEPLAIELAPVPPAGRIQSAEPLGAAAVGRKATASR